VSFLKGVPFKTCPIAELQFFDRQVTFNASAS
jgi:hypothetical protein